MAIVTVGDYALNMDDVDVGILNYGNVEVATSTTFSISYDDAPGVLDTFSGTGLRYNTLGVPVAGVVTGFQESLNGYVAAKITGVNVLATDMVTWTEVGDNSAARNAFLGGEDTIIGGTASDLLRGYAGNDSISGNLGSDTLDGGAGDNVIFGNEGYDYIIGGSGFNRVNGNTGNDTVVGSSNVGDWLLGGQGNDLIRAESSTGHNIMNGNIGVDTVSGGVGNDTLRGGQGDDIISGGSGNDLIFGDLGLNTLTGGAGADTFRNAAGANRDVIADFRTSEGDRIQIDANLTYSYEQSGADVRVLVSNGSEFLLQNTQVTLLSDGWIGH